MQSRAVFLDRDGVLNRPVVVDGVPHPPASVMELEILPGVAEACRLLHGAGLLLIAVTNQPDIARGTQTLAVVTAINGALRKDLGLDDLLMCPHDDGDNCECRKPRPGMLITAAANHDIDLANSVMVGDRERDIAAGHAAGCRTVFVDQGYGTPLPSADLVVPSLRAAVDWITVAIAPRVRVR